MGFLARFFSSYSESFTAAVLAWPFASFALTLPILALLYHRDGRIRLLSAAGAYLSVLYLLGLVCFTLYPLPEGDSGPGITYGLDPIWNPLHFVDDIAADGMPAVAQLVANVALFVPFGFIASRGLRLGMPASVALGFLASLCIEIAQLTGLFGIYPYAYRTFETTDLATNTLGALCGWMLARASLRVLPDPGRLASATVTSSPGIVRRSVAFCIDMTLAAIASAIAGSGLLFLFYALGGSLASAASLPALAFLGTAAVLVVEVAVPWAHGGQTPGGAFVRMTCETCERQGGLLRGADVRHPVRGRPAGHRAPPDPGPTCVPCVLPLQAADALRPDIAHAASASGPPSLQPALRSDGAPMRRTRRPR